MRRRALPLALSAFAFVPVAVAAPSGPRDPRIRHEVPDQPPRPRPESPVPVPPPYRPRVAVPPSVQVNVDASGQNVPNDAANEPSLAVDPTNPLRMVVGWRQFDSITSNFRQAGNGYTTDGGQSWTFPGVLTPGVFRSDPVLDADASGTIYYNSLESNFTCDVFRSTSGGATWSPPVYAHGGDKQWMAIDRTGGIGDGNVYVAWSSVAGCCGMNVFTRSTDGGLSYSTPQPLPQDAIFGTLGVGRDGTLYLSGVDTATFAGYWVFRSSNARDPAQTPSFDLSRQVDLGGSLGFGGPVNPDGLLGQVWLQVDASGGTTDGYVYLLASVDPPGADPLDVHLARSTDRGSTWSAPRRVNDDASTSAYQWFGTLAVAPTGRIDVVWNDTRNDPGNLLSELHYASSTDGGVTFLANVPVSAPWDPTLGWPQQNKIGDYYHMVSDATGASLAYAATFNGEQDVYFVRIPAGGAPDDYLVGSGLGQPNPNRVRIYTEAGSPTSVDFQAYGAGQWGANVAAADVDAGGAVEILTGPGPGPSYGPHVRGFRRDGTAMARISFYAYGTLRYGANVEGGDVDGDGVDEIVTGAGPGDVFGPHVRGFDAGASGVTAVPRLSFFAYATLRFGVNPSTGDLDADPRAELLTGPGPGVVFGSTVRGFAYTGSVSTISGVNFDAYTLAGYGVNVAGGSVDGEPRAEIATAPGPGPGHAPRFLGFDYDGTAVAALPGFDATPFTTHYGARVGLGAVTLGPDDLLAGAGRDPVATSAVRGFDYTGSALVALPVSFTPFPADTFGVNVAAGAYGY